ncbi:MAG: response regulator [Candidatus Aminicenantes bacterium]|nr:response regulator [Candidatus Aminicenantes bacterium]
MIKDRILVIDDEAGIRSSLKGILEDEGFEVKTAEKGEDGLDMIKSHNFDLILLDIWLPKMNGIELLKEIKKHEENIQIIMITGHGTIETAVQATKLGAYDFLEKPLTYEKVILTAKNALKQKKLEEENIRLREKIKPRYELVGKSSVIQKLKEKIKVVAPTDGRVLIYGENGTGKELIARLIHQNSPRKNNSFIEINSAAIPDELIESELFGYVKADFNHTRIGKKGKLLEAEGGTLFLDNISEMSLKAQTELLRVIKGQKFQPLGANESLAIDTRIIATSNKPLKELISKGTFREDLYFKLNVIPIVVPPLRERKEDIPLLINYFLKYFSRESRKKQKKMNAEAMMAFLNYSWPGNISELANVIERFVIMVPEVEIKASHIPLLVEPREAQYIPELNNHRSLKQARQIFEREYIHNALKKNNWNLSQTATDLNIEKSYLDKKIKALGITFFG